MDVGGLWLGGGWDIVEGWRIHRCGWFLLGYDRDGGSWDIWRLVVGLGYMETGGKVGLWSLVLVAGLCYGAQYWWWSGIWRSVAVMGSDMEISGSDGVGYGDQWW